MAGCCKRCKPLLFEESPSGPLQGTSVTEFSRPALLQEHVLYKQRLAGLLHSRLPVLGCEVLLVTSKLNSEGYHEWIRCRSHGGMQHHCAVYEWADVAIQKPRATFPLHVLGVEEGMQHARLTLLHCAGFTNTACIENMCWDPHMASTGYTSATCRSACSSSSSEWTTQSCSFGLVPALAVPAG